MISQKTIFRRLLGKGFTNEQASLLIPFLKEDFYRLHFKDNPPVNLSPETLFTKNSRYMSWVFSYFVGCINRSSRFDLKSLRKKFAEVMSNKDKYTEFSEGRANRKRLKRRKQAGTKSLFLQQVPFPKDEKVHPSFKGYRRLPGSHGRQ
jgi:hypothetical protein